MNNMIKNYKIIPSLIAFILAVLASACSQPKEEFKLSGKLEQAVQAAKDYGQSASPENLERVLKSFKVLEEQNGGLEKLAAYSENKHDQQQLLKQQSFDTRLAPQNISQKQAGPGTHESYGSILARAQPHKSLKDIFVSYFKVATDQVETCFAIVLQKVPKNAQAQSAPVLILASFVELDKNKLGQIKKSGVFDPNLAVNVWASLSEQSLKALAIEALSNAHIDNFFNSARKNQPNEIILVLSLLSQFMQDRYALLEQQDLLNRRNNNNNNNRPNRVGPRQQNIGNPVVVVANPPPPPTVPITSSCIDHICYQRVVDSDVLMLRYEENSNTISRDDFINYLVDKTSEGEKFRRLLTKSIAELPAPGGSNDGYMIWAPVINGATKDFPFYFVAKEKSGFGITLDTTFKPQFKHCNPVPNNMANSNHYDDRFFKLYKKTSVVGGFKKRKLNSANPPLKYAAAIFKGGVNSGPNGSEIMVSPCPIKADFADNKNKKLIHIYSFSKYLVENPNPNPGKLKRLHSFWFSVGKAAKKMFDGTNVVDFDGQPKNELMLNTHGMSVKYLHFRVETEAADYNNYHLAGSGRDVRLRSNNDSHQYYVEKFTP